MPPSGQPLYEQIVRHFLTKMAGGALIISADGIFIKLLRNAIRHLDVSLDRVHTTDEIDVSLRQVSDLLRLYPQLVIFFESNLAGISTIPLFKQIKDAFPGRVRIICTTAETNRERLIYITEMGADNIIVKPVTMNSIIQKTALTIKPNNTLSKLVDATKNLIRSRKLKDAIDMVGMIFKEKPDSTIAHMLSGDIHKLNKEYEAAEKAYTIATNNSKLYIEPLKRLAELYKDTGNVDKHLSVLQRLDTLSPLNHDRKLEIGSTLLELGETAQAKDHFGEAINLVKKHNDELMSSILMDIGKKMQEKDPEASLEYMLRAIEIKENYLSKDDIWMFTEIGINLRKSGQGYKAIEYYQKALKIANDDGAIYYNIGMAFAEMKRYEDAITNFERSVSLTPDILQHSPQISYNIAQVYQTAKIYATALEYYRICAGVDAAFLDAKDRINSLQTVLKISDPNFTLED